MPLSIFKQAERRRLRREESTACASAEEAGTIDQDVKDNGVVGKANERVSAEAIVAGDVIPQIDGTADANANFKLEMEVHNECRRHN